MAQQLVPQLDVGAVSFNSLSALSPIMAALSADNVAPTAVHQLLQLGSYFHISGPKAAQVPDLLQRTSSTRLDRLGILIGWKKGDAASFMAQTVRGQSISLMCLCLVSMCSGGESGGVLHDISERILPKGEAVSSVVQLARPMYLLSDKIAPTCYGNVLAEQTRRIYTAYGKISGNAPTDLYDTLNREGLVEILTSISRVYSEEDCQVRITGTSGMAWILTTMMVMFPHDLTVVVESYVLHKGTQQLIMLDLTPRDEISGPVVIEVEHKIHHSPESRLSLTFGCKTISVNHFGLSYHWNGHLRRFLEVCFTFCGFQCSEEMLVAFCDEMVHLLAQQNYDHAGHRGSPSNTRLPRGEVMQMMGREKKVQIRQTCLEILEAEPSGQFADEPAAFSNLIECFKRSIKDAECSHKWGKGTCDLHKIWEMLPTKSVFESYQCALGHIWGQIGLAMYHGICCFFLRAFGPVVVTHAYISDNQGFYHTKRIRRSSILWDDCDKFYESMMQHFSRDAPLAWYNMSGTIFPATLLDLTIRMDRGSLFLLVDGRIIMNNHYHDQINPSKVTTGRKHVSDQSENVPRTEVIPCAAGVHSDLQISFLVCSGYLEMRAQLFASGQAINLDWQEILVACMGVVDGTPCEHPPLASVHSDKLGKICETSVAAPAAPSEKVAIVQTYRNAVAQLVACLPRRNALLQRRCCLNCAIDEALSLELTMIIVAC